MDWQTALVSRTLKTGTAPGVYRRHWPETIALYEVVSDNLERKPANPHGEIRLPAAW